MRRKWLLRPRPPLQVLPASSSAPKYKFVVPNEYVYKFMQVSEHTQLHCGAAVCVLARGDEERLGSLVLCPCPCVQPVQWNMQRPG